MELREWGFRDVKFPQTSRKQGNGDGRGFSLLSQWQKGNGTNSHFFGLFLWRAVPSECAPPQGEGVQPWETKPWQTQQLREFLGFAGKD